MSIINSFLDTMASLASQSGFAGFLVDGGWKNIVMILISFVFMYLAIAKGFEPLLLLPISFGMLLTNRHMQRCITQTSGTIKRLQAMTTI